jgi:tripartite-type tricarboxylate transporter receptor subunit TctC
MKSSFRSSVSARSLLRVLLVVFLAWCSIAQGQSDYPSRLVRIVVPYPAGGTTDVITRIYAKQLGEMLGQQFLIDNRPGGGTNIGAEVVARSAPDGYTLFVVQAASHGINPSLFGKLNYDPVKDFSSVGMMSRTAMFLVVTASLPVTSVSDLVKYARVNPGKLSYASQGNGSPGHLGGALLTLRTGIDIVHVPYKGAAQAIGDLMVGQVQFGFLSFDGMVSNLVKEGKLKVLAVAASTRWPTEPQIPSMGESGIPDFAVLSFFGLSAPAKTPVSVLEKLNRAVVEITKRDETKKRMTEVGLVPMVMTRDEMTTFINNEIEYWRPIVKAAGVKID